MMRWFAFNYIATSESTFLRPGETSILNAHSFLPLCVCVKNATAHARARTGPDHRQDTTANGRRRGLLYRIVSKLSK